MLPLLKIAPADISTPSRNGTVVELDALFGGLDLEETESIGPPANSKRKWNSEEFYDSVAAMLHTLSQRVFEGAPGLKIGNTKLWLEVMKVAKMYREHSTMEMDSELDKDAVEMLRAHMEQYVTLFWEQFYQDFSSACKAATSASGLKGVMTTFATDLNASGAKSVLSFSENATSAFRAYDAAFIEMQEIVRTAYAINDYVKRLGGTDEDGELRPVSRSDTYLLFFDSMSFVALVARNEITALLVESRMVVRQLVRALNPYKRYLDRAGVDGQPDDLPQVATSVHEINSGKNDALSDITSLYPEFADLPELTAILWVAEELYTSYIEYFQRMQQPAVLRQRSTDSDRSEATDQSDGALQFDLSQMIKDAEASAQLEADEITARTGDSTDPTPARRGGGEGRTVRSKSSIEPVMRAIHRAILTEIVPSGFAKAERSGGMYIVNYDVEFPFHDRKATGGTENTKAVATLKVFASQPNGRQFRGWTLSFDKASPWAGRLAQWRTASGYSTRDLIRRDTELHNFLGFVWNRVLTERDKDRFAEWQLRVSEPELVRDSR